MRMLKAFVSVIWGSIEIGVIHCRCLTSRELLKHHQKCTASDCPVCTPVKQYVQKQRMAMQKQQQDSLRQREAERQRYGESRMQVLLLCLPSCDSQVTVYIAALCHMLCTCLVCLQ